ncbi:MAG: hypothetical protein QOD57_5064, partial [Actinomycetota bacterium]|nr:hypothetical protein [Actinomycetota bacterium]
MEIPSTPKTRSSNGAAFDVVERSLSPLKESLRFCAEVQRSALETFFRFSTLGARSFLSPRGGSSEQAQSAPGSERTIVAAAGPITERASRNPKPMAKRAAATRRSPDTPSMTSRTTAKPATAKPATAKPATAKPATAKPATAKPAAAKPATTVAKPPAKRTVAAPAAAKPTTAKPTTAKPTAGKPAAAKPAATPAPRKPKAAPPATVQSAGPKVSANPAP